MFPWFCKLLSTIYLRLFKECCSVNASYLQRQARMEFKSRPSLSRPQTSFIMVPILIHPNFSRPFFLESDASDYVLRAVLSQKGDDKQLHPMAFHSWKSITIKINYEIHNKELLAIVDSFQEWNIFLKELSIQLQSIPTTRTLSISCPFGY
jgi:hypothetical protein